MTLWPIGSWQFQLPTICCGGGFVRKLRSQTEVFAHIFNGFVHRLHTMDFVQVGGEIEAVATLKPGKELLPLGLLLRLVLQKVAHHYLAHLVVGNVVEADADQPDGLASDFVEQRQCLAMDGYCRRGGVAEGPRTADGAHIGVGELERDAPTAKPVAARTAFDAECQEEKHILEQLVIADILLKGHLAAHRLGILGAIGLHGTVVVAVRHLHKPAAVLAEQTHNRVGIFAQVAYSHYARIVQLLGGLRTYGVKHAHVAVEDKADKILGRGDFEIAASGFFSSLAILAAVLL